MIGQVIAETPWEIQRLGKFTASCIDALLTEPKSAEAKKKGDLSEIAKTYIRGRAAEIITGTIREVTNSYMEWGRQYEPDAAALLKELYPSMQFASMDSPTFFKYSDFAGGSPDGWDKENKLVAEIKCPEDPANHVEYCLIVNAAELKKVQRDYYHQIQMNMLCVAKKFGVEFHEMKGIFASYCPLVADGYLKLKIIEIFPDMEFYEKIHPALSKAEDYLADIIYSLIQKNGQNNSIAVKDITSIPLIKL